MFEAQLARICIWPNIGDECFITLKFLLANGKFFTVELLGSDVDVDYVIELPSSKLCFNPEQFTGDLFCKGALASVSARSPFMVGLDYNVWVSADGVCCICARDKLVDLILS